MLPAIGEYGIACAGHVLWNRQYRRRRYGRGKLQPLPPNFPCEQTSGSCMHLLSSPAQRSVSVVHLLGWLQVAGWSPEFRSRERNDSASRSRQLYSGKLRGGGRHRQQASRVQPRPLSLAESGPGRHGSFAQGK